MQRKSYTKNFSLIELLITIAIISILAGLFPVRRYTPVYGKKLIRPIVRYCAGHTPRKLPARGRNLPLHRILRPLQAP